MTLIQDERRTRMLIYDWAFSGAWPMSGQLRWQNDNS